MTFNQKRITSSRCLSTEVLHEMIDRLMKFSAIQSDKQNLYEVDNYFTHQSEYIRWTCNHENIVFRIVCIWKPVTKSKGFRFVGATANGAWSLSFQSLRERFLRFTPPTTPSRNRHHIYIYIYIYIDILIRSCQRSWARRRLIGSSLSPGLRKFIFSL